MSSQQQDTLTPPPENSSGYWHGYTSSNIAHLQDDMKGLKSEMQDVSKNLNVQMESLKLELGKQKLSIARVVGSVLGLYLIAQWLLSLVSPVLQQIIVAALKLTKGD